MSNRCVGDRLLGNERAIDIKTVIHHDIIGQNKLLGISIPVNHKAKIFEIKSFINSLKERNEVLGTLSGETLTG